MADDYLRPSSLPVEAHPVPLDLDFEIRICRNAVSTDKFETALTLTLPITQHRIVKTGPKHQLLEFRERCHSVGNPLNLRWFVW